MKKMLAILLAIALVFTMNCAVFSEDEVSAQAVETTLVTEILDEQDFEDGYTVDSDQNSITTDSPKSIKFSSWNGSTQPRNYETIEFSDVSGDKLVVKIRIMIEPTPANTRGLFYLQLKESNQTRANLQFDTGSSGGKHNLRLGGSVELLSKEELSDNSFNNIKLIFTSNTTDGTGTVDVYLEDVYKRTINYSQITTATDIKFTEATGIDHVYGYHYFAVRTAQQHDGQGDVFIDKISFERIKTLEYDPSTLTESFDAQMDYTNPTPQIKIANGVTSHWLGQEIKLSLIDAEDDTDVTDVESVAVTKVVTENEEDEGADPVITGSFEFLSDLPGSITPGYYYVNVAQWIDSSKKHDSQKRLYIATAEHLADLPGDFSALPTDESAAKAVVESYLPCFLTDEELNELFPKEDGSYTTQGNKNLTFITKYFQNCGKTFALISEVQTEFEKAKGYLNLKNATNSTQTEEILTEGGYLEDYLEDEVFAENKTAFFTHFDTKRTNEASPLLSDTAIENALRYAYAFTALNIAERSEIKGLVEIYNDIYLIDLTREGIEDVNSDTLYSALYNKNYTDVTKIDEDFSAKLAELIEKKDEIPEEEKEVGSNIPSASQRPSIDDSSNSGGGGSSGGGGKTTVVKTDVPVEVPEIKPEEPTKSIFKDTDGHWAESNIELLYKNGITTGFGDGNFKPENTLTRAEMVAMLARILPGGEGESNPFVDITENDWYFKAAQEAAALGIVVGTDSKFLPNEAITREQLAVMIYRALNIEESGSAAATTFADNEDISSYATEAIAYLVQKGIISGYPNNTVRPQNNTSRAEAAKLLCTAFADIIK